MKDRANAIQRVLEASVVEEAYQRIHPHIIRTTLLQDSANDLWLKCENLQTTGSFKLRGALARLSLLPAGSSVITASTGNHGLGVAQAASIYGHELKVFLPKSAAPKKKEKLKAQGVNLVEVDGDSLEAEMQGKAYAEQHQLVWVSPYNDVDVISGQGTIAKEILEQAGQVDQLYITVGGGGLISGIASWMKVHSPNTKIIGCLPGNSPEMYVSQMAGRVISIPEGEATLSDGSAGPLEEDSITFDLCRKLVHAYSLITEEEIKEAIREVYQNHQMVIEGAAAVAYAAARRDGSHAESGKVVAVLCGSNIDPAIHREICGAE